MRFSETSRRNIINGARVVTDGLEKRSSIQSRSRQLVLWCFGENHAETWHTASRTGIAALTLSSSVTTIRAATDRVAHPNDWRPPFSVTSAPGNTGFGSLRRTAQRAVRRRQRTGGPGRAAAALPIGKIESWKTRMTFPLPLSPFEYYILNDRVDYPMTFFLQFSFTGKLERAILDVAFRTALARHPLLHATIRKCRGNQLEWVAADHLQPRIEWTEQDIDSFQLPNTVIRLESEPGLRIQVIQSRGETNLLLQVHHCCCDGIGAFQFIEDVFVAYHNATPGMTAKVQPHPVEPQRLRARTGIHSHRRALWAWSYSVMLGAFRAGLFLLRKPDHLFAPNDDVDPTFPVPQFPACQGRQFDLRVSQQLQEKAKLHDVTLNDLLLTLVFETLINWNRQHAAKHSNGHIRVGIPVNLRQEQHRDMPAANMVNVTFLDRTPGQSTNRSELVHGISRQMNGIKRRRSGTFLRVMRAFGRWKTLRKLIQSERVFLTATFSNLGEIMPESRLPRRDGCLCVGGNLLHNVEVQAPVRSTMPVFFVVFSYGGRLKSCMSYDSRRFSLNSARALHDSFVHRIESR